LVFSTQAGSAATTPLPPANIPALPPLAVLACALAALTLLLARRPRACDRRLALSTGIATVLIAALFVGCAGSNSTGGSFSPAPVPGTTKGSATLTITATSNSTTVTTAIPVLVQ
jgi:hypothetical protein